MGLNSQRLMGRARLRVLVRFPGPGATRHVRVVGGACRSATATMQLRQEEWRKKRKSRICQESSLPFFLLFPSTSRVVQLLRVQVCH